MDTQIFSSIITATGGLGSGIIGTLGTMRAMHRKRPMQDARCERVCMQMLRMGETMITAMRVSGANDHRLSPYLTQMETALADARAFLTEPA